jgi:hypothetical protein
MNKPAAGHISLPQRWKSAFGNRSFKLKFIIAISVLLVTVCSLPFFFAFIEERKGIVLDDVFVRILPASNVSAIVFLIIWLVTGLMLVRAVQQPRVFILLLSAFTLLTLGRVVSMTLISLDPPSGLIELQDPLTSFFYGRHFISKDLFFSGHTATMYLMFLCLPNKTEKRLALAATGIVGFLVLLQHVHYTVDVIVAPMFTWLVYKGAKIWLSNL